MLNKLSRVFLLTFSLALPNISAAGAPSPQLGQIQPQGLTPKQAKQLLMFTLKHEGYNITKRGIFFDGPLKDEQGNFAHPGYVDFGLGYANPKAGAIEYLGLFSISVSSGDIWETNTCENFSFPALRQIQQKIRSSTKISAADESVLRRGLGCTD